MAPAVQIALVAAALLLSTLAVGLLLLARRRWAQPQTPTAAPPALLPLGPPLPLPGRPAPFTPGPPLPLPGLPAPLPLGRMLPLPEKGCVG